jgi:hypothetical protein
LGELISHPRRILWPKRRDGRKQSISTLADATRGLIDSAGSGGIILLLDAAVPVEQMVAVGEWCKAWDRATLCLVCEPAEREMLLGVEAGGAEYLTESALEQCDGFVIIGDAFAANPMCSQGVFRRRAWEPRTPIVVIDAVPGTASSFATHRVEVSPCMELAALAAVAEAGGTSVDVPESVPIDEMPSAHAAGKAIAKCGRLGVLIAAEYGRSTQWKGIGYVASSMARDHGGGVAPQTSGANALAAVRVSETLGAVSLATALSREDAVWVAIGCDPMGMLGWEMGITGAAAALPNSTTSLADVVFPLAAPGEMGGTFLLSGDRSVTIDPAMKPPAGVAQPSELVGSLAKADGVRRPSPLPAVDCTRRLEAPSPALQACEDPDAALLFCRQAMHDGCGSLTSHGGWQASFEPQPEVRLSPQQAAEAGVKEFGKITVRAGDRACRGTLRLDSRMSAGMVLVPQGFAAARALAPCHVDLQTDTVAPEAIVAEVSS